MVRGTLGRPPKKVVWKVTDDGCIVPSNFKLNQDGYFRKRLDGKLVMYHRAVYEFIFGKIPSGMEVDHKCKNRACCNPRHLQMLDSSSHRSKDNRQRYSERLKSARKHWMETQAKGSELARLFGVSESCGYRWVRTWKAEQEGIRWRK